MQSRQQQRAEPGGVALAPPQTSDNGPIAAHGRVAEPSPPPSEAGASQPPASARYETLTAWRGVACLMVVIYHSLFSGYGLAFPDGPGPLEGVLAVLFRFWAGVPLFFVISGYCVIASADAARLRPGPAGNFFWRRFRRIYPVYWAWLGAAALGIWITERAAPGFFADAFVPDPQGLTLWQWLGNITLTETWRWHFTGGVETLQLSHGWTLCYEEQFYALVGLKLLFARRFFFQALAALTLAVIAGLFILPELGVSTRGLFLDGQWLMFAAGVLVYYTLNYPRPKFRPWAYALLGFGILCAVAAPKHLLTRVVNEPNQSFLWAFLFALLLIPLHRFDGRLSGAILLRPLRFCGEMCYSLYLVHWPLVTVVGWAFGLLGLSNPFVVLLLGLPCCILVSIGIARVFHRLVERRFWNPAYSTAA